MLGTESKFFTFAKDKAGPFRLQSGETVGPVTLAYETYGELSPDCDNAVLVFHALSGSQHAAGTNTAHSKFCPFWTEDCHIGWWDGMIGPRKALDTERLFVICVNYLGGCYGSTGPASPHPDDGKPYGSRFPKVTTSDIVDSQIRLLDHLGIETLHAVVGGSLGGFLSLDLALRYPSRVRKIVSLASGLKVTTLQRVHNFEQLFAIEHDPLFCGGNYYELQKPINGLALARMIAHKGYISLEELTSRARSEVIKRNGKNGFYTLSHPVESYMLHQGQKFVQRFDANTYLRILAAWQAFDLAAICGVDTIDQALPRLNQHEFLVFSINSDVCFYPDEQIEMAQALRRAKIPLNHITVHSDKGHDAFLICPELFTPHVRYFLCNC